MVAVSIENQAASTSLRLKHGTNKREHVSPSRARFCCAWLLWCVEQVACALFLLNAALALILLPSGNGREVGGWTDAAAGAKKKDDDIVNGSDKKDDTLTTATLALDGGAGKSAGRGEDSSSSSSSATRRFLANFKKACSSGPTLRILAAKLIFGFFFRALGSQNFVG